MTKEKKPSSEAGFEALKRLMERLRADNGCPWDRAQTLGSLTPFIIEEAYEVVSAIDSGSTEDIREELGDLLFQVVFAARVAEEADEFDVEDVIKTLIEKMVRRHPHVFGDKKADTPEEVLVHWAEIKKGEHKGGGVLSGVPEAMPALLRAHKISKKAAKAGFDWKDIEGVLDKVTEELSEFSEAIRSKDPSKVEEELGDLLFTIVNAARFLEVSPEEALRKTIGKFMRRFHHIEKSLSERGAGLSTATTEEMEGLWEEAKLREKKISEQKQKG
ncbi:MAG: nucleoside triphosphate pyrophosphohydrolase [Thermodesulfobacteriota bacterium]|nr:MAG: nucleoside triphosphate pyrophosphohydrolase [Thermodesulfobacteriota bacterium]